MTSPIADLFRRLRASFLFVPLTIVLLAAVAAQASVWLSHQWNYEDLNWVPSAWFEIGVEGARGLFSAIASGTLTAATTAFSITVSVIATASTSFGPRLVRNFMSDMRNQVVLGILLGTFVFSLLALRTVHSVDNGEVTFVPHVAVNIALLLALADVVVIIYFIFHISDSIQMETLAGRTRDQFHAAIKILHADQEEAGFGDRDAEGALPEPPEDARWIESSTYGYVVDVNLAAIRKAVGQNGRVWVYPRVGDYVVAGQRVIAISGGHTEGNPAATGSAISEKTLRRAVPVRRARSSFHDIRFAQQEILDLAIRGASSGTNDPYTAINAIEELSEGMRRLVSGPRPRPISDTVIHQQVALKELIDPIFDHLRPYVVQDVLMLTSLLQLAGRMGEACIHPEITLAIREHVRILVAEFESEGHVERDIQRVREEARAALRQLVAL